MKKLFLIVILILFIIPVRAKNIVDLTTPDKICEAVESNKTLLIGIDSYYGKSAIIPSPNNSCSNTANFNENKDKIQNGKMSFVGFGRVTYNNSIKIDDVEVKKPGSYGDYGYFFVSNQKRNAKVSKNSTLNPGEEFYLRMNVSDKNLKSDSYKDLRLKIRYGVTSNDINIGVYNSIGYYVATDKKLYGPYSLDDIYYNNIYTESSSGSSSSIFVHDIVSSNLLKGISSNETIKYINIVPYDNSNMHKGLFRVFSISLDGYSSYTPNRKYVSVNNAEMVTRHNIVNNMYENVSLKWDVKGKTTLYFYHHYVTKPIILKPNTGEILYGIPYVNNIDATINSFINQTTKNKITESNKKKTAYYSYSFTETYLKNTTATNGASIKKGNNVANNIIYVYENNKVNDKKDQRKEDLQDKSKPFTGNVEGYYYGLDCSAATFLPNGRELPYVNTNAASNYYYYGNGVTILGGLSITPSKVEKYLRDKKIISSKEEMTPSLMIEYYDNYMRSAYGEQKIYNAYGLLIPGDIVDTMGHVRMETGYPVVVCKDGTKVGGNNKTKYSNNYCNSHDGIDPSKSYVITTEVGTRHVKRSDDSYLKTHISDSKTGWTYTLNENLTDINSVDDLYDKSKNLSSIFHVNKKYTFEELYDKSDKKNLYLPFRYKEMTKISNTNKVEIPSIKLVLNKDYSNPGNIIYDYMKSAKQLKGTIISNYMIDAIRISINNKSYYIYPNQTNYFSLYKGIKDVNILNAIKKLDYNKTNTITISVKSGPNIASVKNKAGADSYGYIKVVTINNTMDSTPAINYPKGDANGDNKINSTDYIIVRKHILKQTTLTSEMFNRSEITGDGKITSLDYIAIRKIILNNTTSEVIINNKSVDDTLLVDKNSVVEQEFDHEMVD